jgi:hypothetical protein
VLANHLARVIQAIEHPGGSAYAVVNSTEGSAVCPTEEPAARAHVPDPDEHSFPELEADQTIPPRPEEEMADMLRAEPDVRDHRQDRA